MRKLLKLSHGPIVRGMRVQKQLQKSRPVGQNGARQIENKRKSEESEGVPSCLTVSDRLTPVPIIHSAKVLAMLGAGG